MTNSEMKLNFKGGGSITNHRPIFSHDGGTLYVCWKNFIYAYNTKTCKRMLEFKGMTNAVIGFKCHFLSGYECLTACSTRGEIFTWKTETAFRVTKKVIPIDNAVIKTFNIVPSRNPDDDCKAIISYCLDEENRIEFCLYNVVNNTVKRIKKLALKNGPYYVDVNEEYFAVCFRKRLYYAHLNNIANIYEYYIAHKRKFTCVTCHPTDDCILTGDSTGRVVAWKNLTSKNPVQTVFHWHTLPVKTVCFSTSGSYFYSGAGECVLVKWQYDDMLQKNFLPRLPSTIEHISVSENNLYVAVATGDNAVRVIDPKFELIGVIQHLVLGNEFQSGIHVDFHTRSLVMNGITGHIQFYSPKNMDLLYNLDIVGQNKLTDERECKIENTQVTGIALSKSGMWMATSEERKSSASCCFEIRLKFFMFSITKQTFELNTVIEYPHEGSINGLLFRPTKSDKEVKCVTIGDDAKFKIWQLLEVNTVDGIKISWNCQYVGFYKELSSNTVAFSSDGSLLAVGFDKILTTWLPDVCELKCSLYHPNVRSHIRFIEFGSANECHLVVEATDHELCVWNLLTLAMVWMVDVQTSFLVSDPLWNVLALFTKDNKMFVFTPSSSQPLFSAEEFMSKDVSVLAAAFVPSSFSDDINNLITNKWYHHSHLYFIDSNQEMYYFGANDDVSEPYLFKNEETSGTLLDRIVPKHHLDNRQMQTNMQHSLVKDTGRKKLEKFLDSPIHTMLPIRLTCGAILNSFVVEAKT